MKNNRLFMMFLIISFFSISPLHVKSQAALTLHNKR